MLELSANPVCFVQVQSVKRIDYFRIEKIY